MNRTAISILAAASVVGITGGAFAATRVRHGQPPSSGPAGVVSPAAAPSAGPQRQPLLYAVPGRIHDGETVIKDDAVGTVYDLARIEGGYLLATMASTQEPAYHLWTVSSDGTTAKLADVFGAWDVSADGTRVVAVNSEDYRPSIWNVTNGALLNTWRPLDADTSASGDLGWAGSDVVLGATRKDERKVVVRWDPGTGHSRVVTDELSSVSTSPDGTLMAGKVPSADSTVPTCLTAISSDGGQGKYWRECDWTAENLFGPEFSPDGTRVLTYPAQTDGFGPGAFAAVDVRNGRVVDDFLAGDWTLGARWADDEHVYVTGAHDGDGNGTVVRRCDLAGSCRTVLDTDEHAVVGRV